MSETPQIPRLVIVRNQLCVILKQFPTANTDTGWLITELTGVPLPVDTEQIEEDAWNERDPADNILYGISSIGCDVSLCIGTQRIIVPEGRYLACCIYLDNLTYQEIKLRALPLSSGEFSVRLIFGREPSNCRISSSIDSLVVWVDELNNYVDDPALYRQRDGVSGFMSNRFLEKNHNSYFSSEKIAVVCELITKYNPRFLLM